MKRSVSDGLPTRSVVPTQQLFSAARAGLVGAWSSQSWVSISAVAVCCFRSSGPSSSSSFPPQLYTVATINLPQHLVGQRFPDVARLPVEHVLQRLLLRPQGLDLLLVEVQLLVHALYRFLHKMLSTKRTSKALILPFNVAECAPELMPWVFIVDSFSITAVNKILITSSFLHIVFNLYKL